jgi:hypothetical protein
MYQGDIVHSHDDANKLLSLYPFQNWLMKNPDGVSGSGHMIFNCKSFSGTYLMEPIYERVFDIGTTFECIDGKLTNIFMVENLNSKNGSFKGGIAARNISYFKKYILDKYNFDLSELEEITHKIFTKYQTLGATSNVQIDSFVFTENGKLRLYPLVEVNYRKTMGLVLQNLVSLMNSNLIEWKVTHTSLLDNETSWIKISPSGNRFNSFVRRLE